MATAAIATPPSTEKTADAPLMKFAVDRTQFLSEVAAAARVTDGKSTQPLLSHLLLRATGGSGHARLPILQIYVAWISGIADSAGCTCE
jgi:hypothetical protein